MLRILDGGESRTAGENKSRTMNCILNLFTATCIAVSPGTRQKPLLSFATFTAHSFEGSDGYPYPHEYFYLGDGEPTLRNKGGISVGQNGGRRPGAGRKTNASKLLAAGFACNYWTLDAQEKHWKSVLGSKDERIRFEAGKYLTDRIWGKPAQAVDMNHSGDMGITFKLERVDK